MKVLKKIESGNFAPPSSSRLLHQGERPIDPPAEALGQAPSRIRRQIDNLLGPYAKARPHATWDEDRRAWHHYLEDKHVS